MCKRVIVRLGHGYFRGGVEPLPDICPTIDAHIACWHVLIGEKIEMHCKIAGRLGGKFEKTMDCTRRVYDTDGCAPKHNNRIVEPNKCKYRVRKLTEKECGRLMGVKDEDIAKIGKNLSRSAQYHCFGDSIVTTCLMAIFGQMTDIDYADKIEETVKEICKEE